MAPSGTGSRNVMARKTRTAAAILASNSDSLTPAKSAATCRPTVSPSSTTPTPPGVIGRAEISRMKANTART